MSKKQKGSKAKTSFAGYAVLIFFGLFWTAFVSFADYMVASKMILQLKSLYYQPVQATIVKSELGSRKTSDGTDYFPVVAYTYSVGGKRYTGTVIRHSAGSSGDRQQNAKAVIKQYALESTTTAFVDMDDPANAVLQQGITGGELFVVLFLTPFNMVSLGIVWITWQLCFMSRRPLGGLAHTDSQNGFVVEVGRRGPVMSGFVTLGFVSFLSIFGVLIFTGSGFNPSLNAMLLTWGIVLTLSIASAVYSAYMNNTGIFDLEADYLHQTLIVPASKQSLARRTFAINDPAAVILRTVETTDSDNDKTTTYQVEFRMHETPTPVTIGELHVEDCASALARWLATRMRLPLEKATKSY